MSKIFEERIQELEAIKNRTKADFLELREKLLDPSLNMFDKMAKESDASYLAIKLRAIESLIEINNAWLKDAKEQKCQSNKNSK